MGRDLSGGFVATSLTRLDYDGIDLTGRKIYGEGAKQFRFCAMSAGSTFSNPKPITHEVVTGLLYGSAVKKTGYGNRDEAGFLVFVLANNSDGLAAGETFMNQRLAKNHQTTKVLGYRPPDGVGARTEYQVLLSDFPHQWDDVNEARGGDTEWSARRAYRLDMTLGPFGYSAFEVETIAVAPGAEDPETLVISSGTSSAGWTGVTVDVDRLKFNTVSFYAQGGSGVTSYVTTWMTEATYTFGAPVDMSLTPIVSFRIETTGADVWAAELIGNGSESFILQSVEPVSAGEVVFTFAADDTQYVDYTAITTLLFRVFVRNLASDPPLGSPKGTPLVTNPPTGVWIDDVSRTNDPTPRAAATVLLASPGAAPVVGSLKIAAPEGETLGELLLYSSANLGVSGYWPNLSRYSLEGEPFGDWAAEIPLAFLPPGTYLAMYKADTAPIASSGFDFTIKSGGVAISHTEVRDAFDITDLFAGDSIHILGVIELPMIDAPREQSGMVLRVDMPTIGTGVEEVWLFHMDDTDDAVLTHVDATGFRYLWLDHPDFGDLTPGVFVGNEEDKSDARYPVDTSTGQPKVRSWGNHKIEAATLLHIATTDCVGAAVTVTHRPAHFHFAVSIPGYSDPVEED